MYIILHEINIKNKLKRNRFAAIPLSEKIFLIGQYEY